MDVSHLPITIGACNKRVGSAPVDLARIAAAQRASEMMYDKTPTGVWFGFDETQRTSF